MSVSVKVVRHTAGDIPLLLDQQGLPLPGPNEWLLDQRQKAANTTVRNARELALLEDWLLLKGINLDDRICSDLMFSEAELKGDLIERLRFAKLPTKKIVAPSTTSNVFTLHTKTVHSDVFNSRLRTIHAYLSWRLTVEKGLVSSVDPIYVRLERHGEFLGQIFSRSYIAKSPESIGMNNALSDEHLENFKRIIKYSNPNAYGWNEAVKYRNYICAAIMLRYGLRPGELLSLRVEDIVFGSISDLRVLRRNIDPLDTRRPRPSVKRAGRHLIIDDVGFSRELDEYIKVHRETMMNNGDARDHSYLIVSDEGEPLHQNTLNQYFRLVREKFEGSLPKTLTPKMLRHTFSVQVERKMVELGIDEQQRIVCLMYWRGDTVPESQKVYTSAEIIRQSNVALSQYHHELAIPDF